MIDGLVTSEFGASLGEDKNVIRDSGPNTKMGTALPIFMRNHDAC